MNNDQDQELLQLLYAKSYLARSHNDRGNIYIKGLYELCDRFIETIMKIRNLEGKENEVD